MKDDRTTKPAEPRSAYGVAANTIERLLTWYAPDPIPAVLMDGVCARRAYAAGEITEPVLRLTIARGQPVHDQAARQIGSDHSPLPYREREKVKARLAMIEAIARIAILQSPESVAMVLPGVQAAIDRYHTVHGRGEE